MATSKKKQKRAERENACPFCKGTDLNPGKDARPVSQCQECMNWSSDE